ncbi:Bet v1-like protein [Basidiobolus meristosporus CBS 931.73]|uniref:Bet v1-like protein n=1 Tax=Basidiobolus meristosporus CBS 931.73 TaxID=1314790 RepID=A0A1Y1YLG0_9FUNG|nr:Bet v1-like protein [Basidiobolus meristosporus CBS 931.73]|eukprot:ORX98850.1 Bet v1-like protein [Basidiobolus meristosporus CBS 931.73]
MNGNTHQYSHMNGSAGTEADAGAMDAIVEKQQFGNKVTETQSTNQYQSTEEATTGVPKHPYVQECEKMTARFSSLIDEDADAPGSPWTIMVNQLQPSFLKIYKHKDADFCYKIVATADNTPETAFDLLSDVTKRPEWDDLCDSTRIIEELDAATKIQYVKMKPIWPTSARDTVLLSYVKQLEDGRYLNVTQSVVHDQCPDLTSKGTVRMEAGLAGQLNNSHGYLFHQIVTRDGSESTQAFGLFL